MPDTTKTRFMEYLPAVFRQDEVEGENFLGRFLRAFEAIFDSLQGEIEAVPGLFALVPTPVLEKEARAGTATLQLDSAAGLCPGNILHLLDSDPARVEFVEVKTVPPDLIPTIVALTRTLRFDHTKGTPVRVAGPPGPAAILSLPVRENETVLTVAEAQALGIAIGSVLQIDEGELTEYAQVVSVTGASVAVTPTLERPHEAGRPVVLMKAVPLTTPPLDFAHAVRTGPELLLRTSALKEEMVLELDTLTWLAVGDILHLRELDPDRVEFARVQALPPEPVGPGVLRFAIRLDRPLRSDHDPGVEVGVLGTPAGATRLTERAEGGARVLTINDPDALGAASGDVVQVDEGAAAEYAQVVAISDKTVTVTPPLQQGHDPGRPVVRRAPSGSGTAFLGWLAGWIGLALRPDRGEWWNRELLRLAGRVSSWRGTKVDVEAFLNTYLRGEARAIVFDPSNLILQIGLVSTIGVDTIICGGLPHFFWADLVTHKRNSRLYHAEGLSEMVQAAHQALRREKPAHTYYDLRVQAHTMQIGVNPETEVGARVGDTTLLWGEPLLIPGDR
ncbi:MAG: hypothetical protein ACE5I9_02810 [Candidatus Methylomirabilales bacterium]